MGSSRSRKPAPLKSAPPPKPEATAAPSNAPPPALVTRAPGHRVLPPLTRWRDLHLHYVDGLTLLARIGRSHARLTHVDLGMARKNTREPVVCFGILLAMLQGEGQYRWSEFGEFDNVSRQVSYLRGYLSKAFGLDEDPFEPFHGVHAWRPRFVAHKTVPGDDDEVPFED